MKGPLACLLFCLLLSRGYSQVDEVRLLEKAHDLARKNPDSTLVILNKIRPHFHQLKDSVKAGYISIRGNYHFYTGNYDSAVYLYRSNFQGKYLNTNAVKAKMANNLGIIYNFQGKQDSAYYYLSIALDLKNKIADPSVGSTLNNLGLVSSALLLYDEALRYYQQSLKLKIANGETDKLGNAYLNFGNVFSRMGLRDSAIFYHKKALIEFRNQGDTKGRANALNNLAGLYIELGDYSQGMPMAKEALALKRELNDQHGLINSYDHLTLIYTNIGNYPKAKLYADSSLQVAQSIQSMSEELEARYSIVRIDSALGDFKSAYFELKRASALRDNLYSTDVTNRINELKEEYESEQKEQEIARLEQQNEIIVLKAAQTEQQRLLLVLGISFLLTVILGGFWMYRSKVQTNTKLELANEQLQSLNYTKDRLFSIISHDLKSPLSSFHTITKSLTDNWDKIEKEQLKTFVETLRDSSREVHGMMDNLLRWALTQTGQLSYNPQLINPTEVADKVIHQLGGVADLANLTLEKSYHGDSSILADAEYLQIILRNLLSNAIKFSNPGKMVMLHIEENNGVKIISIKDEGVGIKEEDLGKLFESSTSAHGIKNSDKKGTGLGLILCKELMEKMGGKIEVSSEYQKGTVFSLLFPIASK